MKYIKKIFFFISIVLLYIIFRELLHFYVMAKTANQVLGYLVLLVLCVIVIYFIIIPLYKIFKLPKYYGPTNKKSLEDELLEYRLNRFKKNKCLLSRNFVIDDNKDKRDEYDRAIAIIDEKSKEIREKHVADLFYFSAIAQKGFIDAILMLSASINLVKEIFALYNGRLSNRDLFVVGRNMYYSIAIGGSYGTEYAVEEIITKFSSDLDKSIPFLDKILGSIADGFANAALLTRIAFIAENYCKVTYVKNQKDLYPSPKFIIDTAKHITSDGVKKIKTVLNQAVKDKAIDYSAYVVNPSGYIIDKVYEKYIDEDENQESKKRIKSILRWGFNPLGTFVENIIRKHQKKH